MRKDAFSLILDHLVTTEAQRIDFDPSKIVRLVPVRLSSRIERRIAVDRAILSGRYQNQAFEVWQLKTCHSSRKMRRILRRS